MSLIYVRAKPGRIARVAPKGEFIPHDRFIGVRQTPYISRLVNVHGDVEVRRSEPKPAPIPAQKAKDEPKDEPKS